MEARQRLPKKGPVSAFKGGGWGDHAPKYWPFPAKHVAFFIVFPPFESSRFNSHRLETARHVKHESTAAEVKYVTIMMWKSAVFTKIKGFTGKQQVFSVKLKPNLFSWQSIWKQAVMAKGGFSCEAGKIMLSGNVEDEGLYFASWHGN